MADGSKGSGSGIGCLTVMVLLVLALLGGAIGSCSSGGSSSHSGTTTSAAAETEPCPICGRQTKSSTIRWQGMCDSCYHTYQQTKAYEDAATN